MVNINDVTVNRNQLYIDKSMLPNIKKLINSNNNVNNNINVNVYIEKLEFMTDPRTDVLRTLRTVYHHVRKDESTHDLQ